VWLNIRSLPIRDQRGRVPAMMGICRDVTDRKRTEDDLKRALEELEQRVRDRTLELSAVNEQLRRNVERLELTLDAMSDGYWERNLETDSLYFSPHHCALLGYAPEEMPKTHKQWERFVHPEDLTPALRKIRDYVDGRLSVFEVQFWAKAKSGQWRWMLGRGKVVRWGAGGEPTHMVGVNIDITDRMQAQEALLEERETLRRLLEAGDRDRQLISHDIHDGPTQFLVAANMQFESYQYLRKQHRPEAKAAYRNGRRLLLKSIAEVRRLIDYLRPPIITEGGVVAAIAHYLNDDRNLGVMEFEFHRSVAFERLAPALENTLLRIVQEAVSNVKRHSGSRKVRVELVQQDERLRLAIRDWGVVFDPAHVPQGCYGLEGIRQRARLFGGTATIDSVPGRGTQIIVELPMELRMEGP